MRIVTNGDGRPIVVVDADVAMSLGHLRAFERVAATVNLVAPRLLWTECCSVSRRAVARRHENEGPELDAFAELLASPVELVDDYDRRAPWDIASLLGWHKSFDAEYLAAARHVGGSIWSLDRQVNSGARRLGVPIATIE